MKNKKVLTISIVAVVVLVIAIVATSYAMFTADLSGTKENEINSGYVKLECTGTTFELRDTTPMLDVEGIALEDNAATCTLVSTIDGSILIGYDVALTEVDSTPNDSVGEENVKVQVTKSVDGGDLNYLAGTSAVEGVLVSDLADVAGKYDAAITGYTVDSATVDKTSTVVYTVKAWVNSVGDGDYTNSDTSNVCSDPQYTTQSACESAEEIWGDSQKVSQAGGTFSFKLKLGATQTYVAQ